MLTERDPVIELPILSWLSGHWCPGQSLFPAGGAALGYALAALIFLLAKFITVPRAENDIT